MRKAMPGAAIVFLITSFTPLLAAGASQGPNCPRPEIVIAVLEKQYPEIKLTHYTGESARRFVDAYNSGSLAQAWPADEIVIARNPATPEKARVGFFKDGCLLALVPRSHWDVDSLERALGVEQDV